MLRVRDYSMRLQFDKKKITSVEDNRPRFQFIEKGGGLLPFIVEASPSGITIRGTMSGEIQDREDLDSLAEVIGDAWSEHRKLIPKILSATGH